MAAAPAASVSTPAPAPTATSTEAPAAGAMPELITAISAAEAAGLRDDCPAGTLLYTQIYDEATREHAEQLRQRLQQAGAGALRIPRIENVARTAAMRQQRPPVPWQQPTFVVHQARLRPCAQALAQLVQPRWSPSSRQKVWEIGRAHV